MAAQAVIRADVHAAARDAAVVSEDEQFQPSKWRKEAIKGAFERYRTIDMRMSQLRLGKRAC